MSQSPRHVACPRCGTLTPFTPDNPWRPFCCQRCRQIDLGAWAAGEYRVPGMEEKYADGHNGDTATILWGNQDGDD